ncbi:uncharacterized protein [Phaseolus vulgaris]|uniref:uncharacterized protein n=1 Tax=Phaseolus vulgaris TaxID=3885 RepID=UPI0035CC71F9
MEHELELKRLKEQETVERKPKGLALKASEQNEISEEKEDAEHEDTISLLTKRFNKFLKKKSRDRNQQKRRYPKPNDSNSSNYTCFGCGKTGHIKMDCPNNQSKDKSASKKVERSKRRKAYISWEENEVSSTNSSSIESEENNFCFMMKDEGSIFDSVSEFSMESDNYDQLLAAFKETHDEANSLKLKAEGHVTYADNNRGRILGRGTVGTRNSTTIENVLYVEGLKHSLLSISQLCDKGYKDNRLYDVYVKVVVDDYSRFTWILFLAHKNDAYNASKKLAKVLQNENGFCIKSIRSDHGGEFQNARFERFCEKHGISHTFLALRTP